jgi:hypothetical protein
MEQMLHRAYELPQTTDAGSKHVKATMSLVWTDLKHHKQSNYVSSVPADTKKTLHHGALLAFLPILQRVSRTNPLA